GSRRFPLHHPAALRFTGKIDYGGGRGSGGTADHHARGAARRAERDPAAGRALPRRHGRRHHADAEASRRAAPAAGAGPLPGSNRFLSGGRAVSQGEDHEARRAADVEGPPARAGSPPAQRQAEPRKIGVPRKEHLAGGGGHGAHPGLSPPPAPPCGTNLDLKLEEAQKGLESTDPIDRLRLVNDSLSKEITV